MSKEIVYWKMRNGRLISVDDMDINHLRNVLKMIVHNREKTPKQPCNKNKQGALADLVRCERKPLENTYLQMGATCYN